jgi:hypothetical protein
MIYKDKNTRLQTSKHEESREDTFIMLGAIMRETIDEKIIDIFLTLELLFL